ncbi:hypothetical protein [Mycobacteroides abscessus]|uniref:hypothetical protein n=1 Tax=Mycobacteroides abscessus TaxID=36809 RepID=UPI000D8A45F7|nr:hypothetical protein [Mycobacteroides abscessus]SPX87678.1 Uncharacterised protein [Mycobacteroides abscessus]
MQADDALAANIADCISKGIHLTLDVVTEGQPVSWCDHCHEESLVKAKVRGISDNGVYELGTVTACALHESMEPQG